MPNEEYGFTKGVSRTVEQTVAVGEGEDEIEVDSDGTVEVTVEELVSADSVVGVSVNGEGIDVDEEVGANASVSEANIVSVQLYDLSGAVAEADDEISGVSEITVTAEGY